MNYSEIFDLFASAVEEGRAEFFFDHRLSRKACVIDDMVFHFDEEDDGSFSMRYQNVVLIWMREIGAWEAIRDRLAAVIEDEDVDSSEIRRRIYESLHVRLQKR